MPIYAFRCDACGHAFDRLQKLSDPDPVECPVCAEPQVRRQVTAPAFRLAGSGWYETDFKSDKDKKRNLAGKDEAPAPAVDKADKPAAPADKPADKSSKPLADSTPPAKPSTPASPPSEQ